jgi:hypothetical protein
MGFLRDMSQFGQGGTSRRNDPEGFNAWLAARNAPATPTVPAAPTAFQQSLSQPFVPEQAPAMLPMQQGMPQGQMPATKGAGKGPMGQQMPMQVQPSMMQPQGAQGAATGRPVDIQSMIAQLMQSGLLGGL